MNNVGRMRGMQLLRWYAGINYSETQELEATLIDILADLYAVCTHQGLPWTHVVGQAEKWGLMESMADDPPTISGAMTNEQAQRLLDSIFDADPLSANDPEEEDDN